jgi:hypothetical protein
MRFGAERQTATHPRYTKFHGAVAPDRLGIETHLAFGAAVAR